MKLKSSRISIVFIIFFVGFSYSQEKFNEEYLIEKARKFEDSIKVKITSNSIKEVELTKQKIKEIIYYDEIDQIILKESQYLNNNTPLMGVRKEFFSQNKLHLLEIIENQFGDIWFVCFFSYNSKNELIEKILFNDKYIFKEVYINGEKNIYDNNGKRIKKIKFAKRKLIKG